MAESREHHNEILFFRAAAQPRGGGLINNHEGVFPDRPLGMPLGILGDPDHALKLGKEAQQAAAEKKVQSKGRPLSFQQELLELLEQALARQLGELQRGAKLDKLPVRFQPGKTRSELGDPESTKRILRKMNGIGRPHDARLDIGLPAVRILQLSAGDLNPHAVHRQVSAPSRLLEVEPGIKFYLETAVPPAHLIITPGKRKGADRTIAGKQPLDHEDTKGAADTDHLAEGSEDLLEPGKLEAVDLNVIVIRRESVACPSRIKLGEEPVAYGTPNQQRPAAGGCNRLGYGQDLQRKGNWFHDLIVQQKDTGTTPRA